LETGIDFLSFQFLTALPHRQANPCWQQAAGVITYPLPSLIHLLYDSVEDAGQFGLNRGKGELVIEFECWKKNLAGSTDTATDSQPRCPKQDGSLFQYNHFAGNRIDTCFDGVIINARRKCARVRKC